MPSSKIGLTIQINFLAHEIITTAVNFMNWTIFFFGSNMHVAHIYSKNEYGINEFSKNGWVIALTLILSGISNYMTILLIKIFSNNIMYNF